MAEMTQVALHHARRAIQRVNPGCSRQELDVIFVRQNYGDTLADGLRDYLTTRP